MEKDLMDLKVDMSEVKTTVKYIKERIDKLPNCDKDLIKERIKIIDAKTKLNRFIIWAVCLLIVSSTAAVLLQNSISRVLK